MGVEEARAGAVHGILVIARKNALLYYLRAPVLIFGVLFPVFFFLAFSMGRSIPHAALVPGMVAMALWFTSSAVGPLVTPWERRARTYERLISSPVPLAAIVMGDALSGFLFGVAFSIVSVALGLALTDASVQAAGWLALGLVLGGATFATLGVLLAAPPATSPSHIMMLSNLVRLPLLFVSGVFVPIARMPRWAQWASRLSPLSYAADLIRMGFGQEGYFSPALSAVMLVLFTALMLWVACRLHLRWRAAGL